MIQIIAKKCKKYKMRIIKIKNLFAKLQFNLHSRNFGAKNQLVAIWQVRLKPHIFFASALIYIIILFLASLSLTSFLDATNLKMNIPMILASAGAMLGGILAIIFSFGTLLMQNTANSSSAGFYNLVGRDCIQHVIYWILSLTVIYCFGLSIILGRFDAITDHSFIFALVVSLAFFLIGFSFLLLYILFQRTYRRINPFTNVNLVQKEALNYIKQVSKTAKEIANLSLKQPNLPVGYDQHQALAVSYLFVKPQIAAIATRLNYLFDFHDKLVSNKEQEFAKFVLTTTYNILIEYMRQRSTSSIVIPDRDIFFTSVSDSQDFLGPQLENLLNRGKAYIRENNDNGVTHVIRLIRNLTLASVEIKYVTKYRESNPIFSQCQGSLDQLTLFSLNQNAFEASFQCAGAYLQIGPIVCQKQMGTEVMSIVSVMSTLCISSLISTQDVVWGRGMDVCIELLRGLIRHFSYSLKIQIGYLFNTMIKVVLLSHKSQICKGPLAGINNQVKLDGFFMTVVEEAGKILNEVDKPSGKKKDALRKLLVVAEAYRSFLRKLSEEIKTADTPLIKAISDSIANFGIMLLYASTKTDDPSDKQELLKQVGWCVHQPGWFLHYAEKASANTAFDSLVDAPAKIGLYAVEIKEEKIAQDAIDAITQIALDIFEKEDGDRIYGYTPPRTMEIACYVGIVAFKNKMPVIVEHLKKQLDKFQEKYEKETISKLPSGYKSIGPRKDQICHDLFQLRDDCMEARHDRFSRRIIDRARDRLVEKINLADLDRFIYEFWKTWVKGSPIEHEIIAENRKTNEKNLTSL